jgi:hypothetical protein
MTTTEITPTVALSKTMNGRYVAVVLAGSLTGRRFLADTMMEAHDAATAAIETAEQTAKLYDRIESLVRSLNEAMKLDPTDYNNRVSYGYIGNCGMQFDDRYWMVFLPHPGRAGNSADHLGGHATNDHAGMLALINQLSGAITMARTLYR